MSKVLCLCPTYGRRPEVIESTIACFLAQDHKDKFLLVYDDLGNYSQAEGKNWKLLSDTDRVSSLPAKYMKMFGMVDYEWTHYAVWDDDDLYLPWHLSSAAEAAGEDGWAKQSTIWTTYAEELGGYREEPNTGGRFHGSLVISRPMFITYPISHSKSFDLEFIAGLNKIRKPSDHKTSYVYRWTDAAQGHLSGTSTTYDKYQPEYTDHVPRILPCFDDPGFEVYMDILLKD